MGYASGKGGSAILACKTAAWTLNIEKRGKKLIKKQEKAGKVEHLGEQRISRNLLLQATGYITDSINT